MAGGGEGNGERRAEEGVETLPQGAQQRAAKRVAVGLAADIAWHGWAGPVRMVDLSAGGVLMEAPEARWPGPEAGLRVSFTLAGRRLDLFARLVRRVGQTRAAASFSLLDGPSEAALARFVQEQELKAVREQQHLADD